MTETNQLLKAMLNNVARNEDVNYTLEEGYAYLHDKKEVPSPDMCGNSLLDAMAILRLAKMAGVHIKQS